MFRLLLSCKNTIETSATFRLGAKDRLKGASEFKKLFESGESFYIGIFKVQFLVRPYETTGNHKIRIQAGFVVSRRFFKRAVKRNLLKRRMREVYRKEFRTRLISLAPDQQLSILFIYNARAEKDYTLIEQDLIYCLDKLNHKICSDPLPGF